MTTVNPQVARLNLDWNGSPRWRGVTRPYSAEDVVRLRGSVHIEHTLARLGAEKFWNLLQSESVIGALGCMSGNQAVQAVQAGLKAIYCSGWQVAGDGNSAGQMYPDQSLYPVDSVPKMVERINNALLRTDQIHHLEGRTDQDWLAPIVADAEAGFGGNLNAFELTKALIAPARPRSTLKISFPRPRNAATWAAKYWCRPKRPSKAGGGAPGRRCHRRAHGADRAHGRRRGDVAVVRITTHGMRSS